MRDKRHPSGRYRRITGESGLFLLLGPIALLAHRIHYTSDLFVMVIGFQIGTRGVHLHFLN